LESKIKECDAKLSDASQYDTLVNDKTFFENYNQLKSNLEKEMSNWEQLNEKLT
jgi:hypothetical protein